MEAASRTTRSRSSERLICRFEDNSMPLTWQIWLRPRGARSDRSLCAAAKRQGSSLPPARRAQTSPLLVPATSRRIQREAPTLGWDCASLRSGARAAELCEMAAPTEAPATGWEHSTGAHAEHRSDTSAPVPKLPWAPRSSPEACRPWRCHRRHRPLYLSERWAPEHCKPCKETRERLQHGRASPISASSS